MTNKSIIDWFPLQCTELNSPIVQLFIRPLGRPMVFLADWRETQDILTLIHSILHHYHEELLFSAYKYGSMAG